ncbi:hypothetical protein [Mucilaginibacter sp.]|uniref:hypothetical protein n=1 Tax=Mucilaginibacter sp. TaxID=1882438 RepID=UPI00263406EE|nr:hypothetical protein [Mucilaginibacter sp.]
MNSPVKLTRDPVLEYQAIIPGITDKQIPQNFEGVPMTIIDLYNLLLSKFPDINIYKITGAQPLVVHVYAYEETTAMGITQHFISIEQRNRLMLFLTNLGVATTWEIIEDKVVAAPELDKKLVQNPIQFLNSNKLWTRNIGEFSDRDESLWFDHIEDIYEGTFKKDKLYFYKPDDYACYIDYTGGSKHIDIRNFLLLYQTIFVTPPYEKDIKQWLAEQRITEQEYFELVSKGRIKIVLTQPESRYRMELFNEMYKIAPDSIITRRAVAALQQIDLIELSDNFLFKDLSLLRELKAFSETAAPLIGQNPKIYYEMLTWPIKARRNSFEMLHQKGNIATAAFGVNNFASKIIEQRLGKNYDFEFSVSAANIHFAHALNATYYPYQTDHKFSDRFFTHVMGIYLNMFKLATPEHISMLSKTDNELPVTPIILNPIDIIDVNSYTPILEFENIMDENRAYPAGKRLMDTLAVLSPEKREAKIAEYNRQVNKAIQRQNRKAFSIDLLSNGIIDGIGALSNAIGLGTAYAVLRQSGRQLIKQIPEFKNISNTLEDVYYKKPDKANVHFLTKINRVAGLKKF